MNINVSHILSCKMDLHGYIPKQTLRDGSQCDKLSSIENRVQSNIAENPSDPICTSSLPFHLKYKRVWHRLNICLQGKEK